MSGKPVFIGTMKDYEDSKQGIDATMTEVKMIQTSKYRWKIVSPAGHVLLNDIHVNNIYNARKFVENYISSYRGWTYKLEPLEEK